MNGVAISPAIMQSYDCTLKKQKRDTKRDTNTFVRRRPASPRFDLTEQVRSTSSLRFADVLRWTKSGTRKESVLSSSFLYQNLPEDICIKKKHEHTAFDTLTEHEGYRVQSSKIKDAVRARRQLNYKK